MPTINQTSEAPLKAQARDFITGLLSKISIQKQNHDAVKAAKDEEYNKWLSGWKEIDDTITDEIRRYVDMLHVLDTTKEYKKVPASGLKTEMRRRGRLPTVNSAFILLLSDWHKEHPRIYQQEEFFEYAESRECGLDRRQVQQRLHTFTQRGQLMSVRFDGRRASFYGPHNWFIVHNPHHIEIKKEHDNPLFSCPNGERLPTTFRGMTNTRFRKEDSDVE